MLIGAAIAFPVGLRVGNNGSPAEPAQVSHRPAPAGPRGAAGRDVYSPRIATDPYIREQQRNLVEALKANCRQFGRYCTQAEQARRRIDEAEARQ